MFERLRASLDLDASGFRSGANEAEDSLRSLDQRAADVGQSMQRAGAAMTAGVTAPLALIGKRSVDAASDAEEMQGKMQQVFGDLTNDIQSWAQSHADAVGRSEYQLQEYATSLQDTFVPMGFARDEAAKMSKEVSELAIDLASFNNMAEDEALNKLESGLMGNHRALRDFGVAINQSTLEQELLNQGIEGGVQAASEQEKMMARMNIIMRSTKDAQGDAARTADSLANQQRALKAQVRDLSVEMGQHLMPAMQMLINGASGLTTSFQNLSSRQQKLVTAFAAVAAATGPVLLAIGTFLTLVPQMVAGAGAVGGALTALTGPIGLVALAVAGLAAAFATDFMGIRTKTMQAVSAVMPYLERLRLFLANRLPQALIRARAITNQALTVIRAAFTRLVSAVMAVLQPFISRMRQLWQLHGQQIVAEVTQTLSVIRQQFSAFVSWARPYIQAFTSALTTTFQTFWGIVEPLFAAGFENIKATAQLALNTVATIAQGFADTLLTTFRVLLAAIRGDWDEAWNLIKGLFSRQVDRIVSIATGFRDTLLQVFSNLVDGVIGVFENLYETLVGNSIIPDMLNDIIGAVKNFDLPGAFDGPLSDALGTVQDMAGEFLKSGKELASSVADGIKSKASAVGNAASDIASKARNKMPFSPAKEGPLSDLDKVGPAFVDVVAEGMESDADRVDEASRLVAENARPQTSRARSAGGAGTADVEAALASADRTDEVLRKLDQVVRALEALSTGEIREKDVLRALNIAEDRHSGRDPLP